MIDYYFCLGILLTILCGNMNVSCETYPEAEMKDHFYVVPHTASLSSFLSKQESFLIVAA